MNNPQPVKPETEDPIQEAIDHPDGASLDEIVYGKEEENKYPNQNEIDEDVRKLSKKEDS